MTQALGYDHKYKITIPMLPNVFPEREKEATLSVLPPHVLLKIFILLDCNSLIQSCRPVCKRWEKLVYIVPPKMLTPPEFWKPEELYQKSELFSLRVMSHPAERLDWANVQRYRKALTQQPEEIKTMDSATNIINILSASRAQLKTYQPGNPDNYHFILKNLMIEVQANFEDIPFHSRNIYIEIWKSKDVQISRMKFPNLDDLFLKDVQFAMSNDLLTARLTWSKNKKSDNNLDNVVQILFCQFENNTCILNSHSLDTNDLKIPSAVLNRFKEYKYLRFINIHLVGKNKRLQICLLKDFPTDESSQTIEQKVLEYDLDVSPNTPSTTNVDVNLPIIQVPPQEELKPQQPTPPLNRWQRLKNGISALSRFLGAAVVLWFLLKRWLIKNNSSSD